MRTNRHTDGLTERRVEPNSRFSRFLWIHLKGIHFAHRMYICILSESQYIQTTIIYVYINLWIFVTETVSIYCAGRTAYLNLIQTMFVLKEQMLRFTLGWASNGVLVQITSKYKSSACVVWRSIVHTTCITWCLWPFQYLLFQGPVREATSLF
jgi:hypothetical protein